MATGILDDLKSGYRRAWWAIMLRGVLGLIVGLLVIMRPLESVGALALVIAFWSIINGVVEIMHAIDLKGVMKHWWVLMLSGVVSVGFGCAALYYPGLSLTFAVLLVTWWLMATGLLSIYAAMEQRKLDVQWGWTLAFGVASIIAAGFALAAPPVTLVAIMALIATYAIVSGSRSSWGRSGSGRSSSRKSKPPGTDCREPVMHDNAWRNDIARRRCAVMPHRFPAIGSGAVGPHATPPLSTVCPLSNGLAATAPKIEPSNMCRVGHAARPAAAPRRRGSRTG